MNNQERTAVENVIAYKLGLIINTSYAGVRWISSTGSTTDFSISFRRFVSLNELKKISEHFGTEDVSISSDHYVSGELPGRIQDLDITSYVIVVARFAKLG